MMETAILCLKCFAVYAIVALSWFAWEAKHAPIREDFE